MLRRSLVLVAVAVSVVSCNTVPPLANSYSSPELLANAVLEALGNGDRARLDSLALSEQEFRDYVWPDLPAAQPGRNLPFSYVWGDLRQKSQLSLSSVLQERVGQRLTAERVTFAGQSAYATYHVHREATFHVRDASGETRAIRVCGSMIEKDGWWKVFSYVVDE